MFDAAFSAQFEALLHWRRDVRHFQRHPLPDGALHDLVRLACLAPSVGNAQPSRFVRISSAALRAQLADHVDAQSASAARAIGDENRRTRYYALKLHGIREAPELVAVLCDDHPAAGHGLGIATMPEMLRYSTVMAIHSLWLAARAKAIGVGWVSILDPRAVTDMLAVPDSWTLIALLCVGYPSQASDVPELEQRGWQNREPWAERMVER